MHRSRMIAYCYSLTSSRLITKISSIAFIVLLGISNLSAACPIAGDQTLNNQADVDALVMMLTNMNCTEIDGKLKIEDTGNDITDLTGLHVLTSIGGPGDDDLEIKKCDLIDNADLAFPNLVTIGGKLKLEELNNAGMTLINGFNALNDVEEIEIKKNENITDITGFAALNTLTDKLKIEDNDELLDISNFTGTTFEDIEIKKNKKLADITGFGNVMTLTKLKLEENALTQISGFVTGSSVMGDVEIKKEHNLTNAGLKAFTDKFIELEKIKIDENDGITMFEYNGKATEVEIKKNKNLTILKGFNDLETLEKLKLEENDLMAVHAFGKLKNVTGEFKIKKEHGLSNEQINALFQGLMSVEKFKLEENDGLTSVACYQGDAGSTDHEVEIKKNKNLVSLLGFANLVTLKKLKIEDNDDLADIKAFQSLMTVDDETKIKDNPSLTDVCGLMPLFDSGTANGQDISNNNGFNSAMDFANSAACVNSGEGVCFSEVVGFDVDDPCSCDDPQNFSDGSFYYFHDVLTVTSMPLTSGLTVQVTAHNGEFRDSNGDAVTTPLDLTEIGATGVYEVDFWHRSGETATGIVALSGGLASQNFASSLCDVDDCPQLIPTLGEWALIILALSCLIVGTIAIKQNEVVVIG